MPFPGCPPLLTFFLFALRGLAALFFLEISIRKRQTPHKLITLGWAMFALCPGLALFSSQQGYPWVEDFLNFNGLLLLSTGLLLFHKKPRLFFLILAALFLNLALAGMEMLLPLNHYHLSQIGQTLFSLAMLTVTLTHFKHKHKGINSTPLWLITVTLVNGYLIAHPSSEALILVNLCLFIFFIRFDRSQREKKLYDEEKRYQQLFETAPISLWEENASQTAQTLHRLKESGVQDIAAYFETHPEILSTAVSQLGVLRVNQATLELFEAETQRDLIENLKQTFTPEAFESLKQVLIELFQGKNHVSLETTYQTLKGNPRDILVDFHFPNLNDLTKNTIISMVDITDRNKAQKSLAESLEEKEVLLKEVHHRVKNNMAIISSLIDLQMMKETDPVTEALLLDIESRIRSMALVHEQLYQSHNLKSISVREYLDNLVETLLDSFWIKEQIPDINKNIENTVLELDTLIPLGLLVNEILSNSLKHAFQGVSQPQITLNLTLQNDHLLLQLGDNGTGLPSEENLKNNDSLGWMLIEALTQQLSGELGIQREKGTLFIITIPLPKTV